RTDDNVGRRVPPRRRPRSWWCERLEREAPTIAAANLVVGRKFWKRAVRSSTRGARTGRGGDDRPRATRRRPEEGGDVRPRAHSPRAEPPPERRPPRLGARVTWIRRTQSGQTNGIDLQDAASSRSDDRRAGHGADRGGGFSGC